MSEEACSLPSDNDLKGLVISLVAHLGMPQTFKCQMIAWTKFIEPAYRAGLTKQAATTIRAAVESELARREAANLPAKEGEK